MFLQDTSVKEHGYSSALCSICRCCETSVLNYGTFIPSIVRATGLTGGYVCLLCQYPNKEGKSDV